MNNTHTVNGPLHLPLKRIEEQKKFVYIAMHHATRPTLEKAYYHVI